MSIQADNNGNYGGNLINQKYSPLANIDVANQRQFYEEIFQGRIDALANANIFPRTLKLFANWPQPGEHPPIIVVSSRRAWWLRSLFINMENKGQIDSYNDDTTFSEGPVPWYAPLRSGGRHCYIVVHQCEYDYYVSALKDDQNNPFANFTIVGYSFGPYSSRSSNESSLAGFGASRYAALATGIELGYPQAWLVDDNVVQINGFPATLDIVEGNLGDLWAIGFSAATNNIAQEDLYNDTTRFPAIPYDIGEQVPGLLQQVVLWNLDLLRANNINISPYFCASNEDVSISNDLQAHNRPEKVISPLSILKLIPDNGIDGMPRELMIKQYASSKAIAKRFDSMLQLFVNQERSLQIHNQDLIDYVGETILPNSQARDQPIPLTESRAIEQALSVATDQGWAPDSIFIQELAIERIEV